MYNARRRPEADLRSEPVSDAASESVRPGEQIVWLLFIAAHVPLGLLMKSESIAVFVQGALVFGAGLWWSFNPRRTERVAYAGAYIVGSEVLWRMLTDALPWESGKYALIVIFSSALLNRHGIRSMVAAALCFGLLVPSAFLTMQSGDATLVRNMLSFNLSGPLALVVCANFFSRLELSPATTLRLFMALAAPVVAIGTIVVSNIMSLEQIHFTFESNFATSGGFGPNQVSLALGLGALASLWCVLERDVRWPLKISLFGVMLWLGTQSALTFSRGGLLGALISGAIALAFLATHAESRKKLIIVVPIVFLFSSYVIWPALVNFTGGALAERFSETGLTHRDELGKEDLELWYANPILGVGPGLSPRHHLNGVAAHTEFTRLVAEHGVFGAFSIMLLLGAGARNVFRAASAREKGLVASALTWSVLFMLNSAMRTVAPCFMYGLSFNVFKPGSAGAAAHAPEIEQPRVPARRQFGRPEPASLQGGGGRAPSARRREYPRPSTPSVNG
jgi:hypothetical protein